MERQTDQICQVFKQSIMRKRKKLLLGSLKQEDYSKWLEHAKISLLKLGMGLDGTHSLIESGVREAERELKEGQYKKRQYS